MMTLHSHRVIHRDLKPGNVLLDSDYHPFITDFGLSKFLDSSESNNQSQSGCGPFAYIAPEVILSKQYGPKADVYSFGILMYEIVSGEGAYAQELMKQDFSEYDFLTMIAKGKRPEFHRTIKPSLRLLIEQCWSANPRERPSFRELFQKLSLFNVFFDDDMIECKLQSIVASNEESHQDVDLCYCLDNVDINRVYDYVEEILTQQSMSKEEECELIIQRQLARITELEEQNRKNEKKSLTN